MRIFDADQWRAILTSSQLEEEYRKRREDYLPNAVGNAARTTVQICIYAILVGMRRDVEPLLIRSRNWLEDAIRREEQFGLPPSFFAAARLEAMAMAIWLLDRRVERALYRQALPLYEQTWRESSGGRGLSEAEIRESYAADFFCDCLLSRDYGRAVSVWHRLGGRVPANVADIMNEAELGYWLCQSRWGEESPQGDTLAAAERILEMRMGDEWLGRGHALQAATWLQIVYWESAFSDTPEATLLKAYDLMPDVSKPVRL